MLIFLISCAEDEMGDDEFPSFDWPEFTFPNGADEPEYPSIYLNVQNLRLGGFLADFASPIAPFLNIRYDLIFAAPAFGSTDFYFGLCLSPRDNITLIPDMADIQNVSTRRSYKESFFLNALSMFTLNRTNF